MSTVITIKVVAAIMMIWSRSDIASAVRFDTMDQCNAARTVVLQKYKDTWSGLASEKNVECIPVTQSTEYNQ